MSDVVLKGELHSSSGDLENEKELLKQGFDTLVLEGDESESEYGWTDGWFQISIFAMFWILGRVYMSKEVLRDLAEIQGTEIVFTRESDSEILENTPWFIKIISGLTFYILVPGSVAVGLVFPKMWGATVLLMGITLPVLLIRMYNTQQSSGEENRDRIMAEKVVEAAENGSVLAVVGLDHIDGMLENLPDDLDVKVVEPVYSKWSRQNIREVAFPFFEAILVLYSLFLLVSWLILKMAVLASSF